MRKQLIFHKSDGRHTLVRSRICPRDIPNAASVGQFKFHFFVYALVLIFIRFKIPIHIVGGVRDICRILFCHMSVGHAVVVFGRNYSLNRKTDEVAFAERVVIVF